MLKASLFLCCILFMTSIYSNNYMTAVQIHNFCLIRVCVCMYIDNK